MPSSAVSLSSSSVSSSDALDMPGSFPVEDTAALENPNPEHSQASERENGSKSFEQIRAPEAGAAQMDQLRKSVKDNEPMFNGYAPLPMTMQVLGEVEENSTELRDSLSLQQPPAVQLHQPQHQQQEQQQLSSQQLSSQQQQLQSAKLTRAAPHRASMRPPAKPAQRSPDKLNWAFYTPVPLNGNPTEVLSSRFSVWRRVLKECISYFEEVAVAQDQRARSHLRLAGVINVPFRDTGDTFLRRGGIQDSPTIIRDYHKQSSLHSADAAKQINEQVVPRLKDLRRDLNVKIKEIKGLSGDFKNSVAKELDLTKKQVSVLTEALSAIAVNPHLVAGKYDPYIIKLATEKQLRKQIDEENYLHQVGFSVLFML